MLQAIGPSAGKAVPALLRLLEEDDATRGHVLAILPDLGPDALRSLPAVEAFLHDWKWAVSALFALSHFGAPALPILERALQDRRFFVRARNETELAALKTRVASCFHAGASATGAEVEIEWGAIDYRELRRNPPLERIFERNARTLGREFFPIEKLPASVAGSTDMGNVSQRVPSIHPMLAAAPPHCTIHNAEFAQHACSELGDRAALDGAKALAMTALDFFCDEDLRSEAREAFEGLEPTAAR